ncbi:LexA-binding, inner membrane-associated putative hydrolase [Methanococcoides vulcani]|uniref:LexA-binding, inner membrane-associated putative hydrolase n=1 Tax=Methanococcoides vulcani TaxID=1353158 RepID=A0A1H9Y2N0_9EURY|nr:metal-dependent hydrolase [Methanococcoides vulcani]SES63041.1 LexA-binding, inner membrane-associated putative hydrolase [Methanococcoides vulcani]
MPYPVAHVMFFVFCICAIAVYTIFVALLRRDISSRDIRHLLLLLFIGAFFALYPDITAGYNIIVNGTLEHTLIGPIPTHSLLFSSFALLFGAIIGYMLYREFGKAVYMGLFAESASLSHLLLDDLARGGIHYFYPISSRAISVFSYMDVGLACGNLINYMLASYAAVFYLIAVMMMALFALNHLGFEFRYRSEK